MEEICKSCMEWFDCPHHNPWGENPLDDNCWCDHARNVIGVNGALREVDFSVLKTHPETVRQRGISYPSKKQVILDIIFEDICRHSKRKAMKETMCTEQYFYVIVAWLRELTQKSPP